MEIGRTIVLIKASSLCHCLLSVLLWQLIISFPLHTFQVGLICYTPISLTFSHISLWIYTTTDIAMGNAPCIIIRILWLFALQVHDSFADVFQVLWLFLDVAWGFLFLFHFGLLDVLSFFLTLSSIWSRLGNI